VVGIGSVAMGRMFVAMPVQVLTEFQPANEDEDQHEHMGKNGNHCWRHDVLPSLFTYVVIGSFKDATDMPNAKGRIVAIEDEPAAW
jgi:hypothetical protein